MPRQYTLRRRADRLRETARRIVEAAIALHTSVGPAASTVSAIAQKAGVQRHTVYRHFPSERALLAACSETFDVNCPWPDPRAWRGVRGAEARLRRGLGEYYEYLGRYGDLLKPIVRDAERHAPTREVVAVRLAAPLGGLRAALIEPFGARGARRRRLLTAIDLVLSLHGWNTVRAGAASAAEAVEMAVRVVLAQR